MERGSSDSRLVTIGSTAAVVGLAAVVANTTPFVAALVAGSGAAVAMGALYKKLTNQQTRELAQDHHKSQADL
jgi:hypothetical protein